MKEQHQGLMKLRVPLAGSYSVGKNGAMSKRMNFL